ncbi:hypothetical protein F5Y05DRAFT_424530 [Hypoxylon sp. FL0543]|nr:hypothetical protein F5Y05DRAFT_424530 [Hypoxylon sp. FL0543]
MARRHRFSLFTSLPPEIRAMIWKFALPADTPEILYSDLSRTTIPISPAVYTNYPAIMHVCREARHLAQKKIQLAYSTEVKCEIPYRPLRPDLDIIRLQYQTGSGRVRHPSLTLCGIADLRESELAKQVQHVILDDWHVFDGPTWYWLGHALGYLPRVRTVYVALTPSRGAPRRGRYHTLERITRSLVRYFEINEYTVDEPPRGSLNEWLDEMEQTFLTDYDDEGDEVQPPRISLVRCIITKAPSRADRLLQKWGRA